MSIIPLGIVGPPPIDASRFAQDDAVKQVRQDQTAAPQQMQGVDPVSDAEEVGFGMLSRGLSRVAQQEKSSASRKDNRRLMLHAFRIGRLKGMNAAFDESFWRSELPTRADGLLQSARSPGGSIEQLADETTEKDPFKRYLFLLAARQIAKPEEPAAKKLDDALDRLWERHETVVVSGFNTMVPLLSFARNVQEWDQFRGIYIDYVVPGELAKTFKAVLDRFGPARLRMAIDALRKAIAADMSAPIVCVDKNRWQQGLLDLVDNRRISSLVASASDFCRELLARDPMPDMVMSFVGGTFDLAAGPNDRKFNALCALLVPEEEINEFLRRRVRVHLKQHLPLWLWSSPEARDTILFPPMFRPRL